jgi:SAM-dependent methyltransferase
MNCCLVCRQPQCVPLVDFGRVPISHHFYDGTQEEFRQPMVFGQCTHCAQAQLLTIAPPEVLVPRYDWLVNNEPEAHLDELIAALCRLPGITKSARVCGVSHKDDSTLRRFRESGFTDTRRLDLGIRNPRAGVETVQQKLKPELASGFGKFDLVIARHILEHTHNPRLFMEAIRGLVGPAGYIVCEIPDCALPFELLDYTALWEEHSLYFSAATLCQCLHAGGFRIEAIHNYPAPYETAIVAVARVGRSVDAPPETRQERERVRSFAKGFHGRRQLLRTLLSGHRQAGKIALFGAGHHASIFTNLLGVADLIEFVVDDNPHKRGLRMPGTRLPIVGSDRLMTGEIKLCLSSLGAGSEREVLAKLRRFIESGGRFASVFPTTTEEALTFRTE